MEEFIRTACRVGLPVILFIQVFQKGGFSSHVFLPLQYSTQPENRGFSQWADPPAIDPYQHYIDYLEDVVVYNLKRELSEALTSLDTSSSAGDDQCCKCSTCTCECHKKNNPLRKIGPLHLHHPHPHLGTMPSQHSGGSMLSRQFSYN
jgi:hypothetical protein